MNVTVVFSNRLAPHLKKKEYERALFLAQEEAQANYEKALGADYINLGEVSIEMWFEKGTWGYVARLSYDSGDALVKDLGLGEPAAEPVIPGFLGPQGTSERPFA